MKKRAEEWHSPFDTVFSEAEELIDYTLELEARLGRAEEERKKYARETGGYLSDVLNLRPALRDLVLAANAHSVECPEFSASRNAMNEALERAEAVLAEQEKEQGQ